SRGHADDEALLVDRGAAGVAAANPVVAAPLIALGVAGAASVGDAGHDEPVAAATVAPVGGAVAADAEADRRVGLALPDEAGDAGRERRDREVLRERDQREITAAHRVGAAGHEDLAPREPRRRV